MIRDVIMPKEGETCLIFFGGKGGVGKSSMAAATAVWLADNGYKTLLASTDLQKSQNDILCQGIGSNETKVKGVNNLEAINIDAKGSIRKHQVEVLKKIGALKGEDWEIQFLKEYWEKNPILPCGTASYNVFVQYLNSRDYDVVVFDTAPGGHNFEMIGYPWTHLDRLKRSILAKKQVADLTGKMAEIELLEQMAEENLRAIKKLSSDCTGYLLVLHPEMLPIYETKRIQASLEPYGISVKGLIINQIFTQRALHKLVFQGKKKTAGKNLNMIRKEFPYMSVGLVPMIETEIVGLDVVRRIGEILYGGEGKI